MIICLLFFIFHWYLSLFCQSFFLHRYSSHKMFYLSPFWEKAFYFLTFVAQGASFLNPRAYGYMHTQHHQNSDQAGDPHSPHQSKNLIDMMWKTFHYYEDLIKNRNKVPDNFKGVEWPALDQFADTWIVRLSWIPLYISFYYAFAPSNWFYLMVPVHAFMGPIHGMIVNWCGHKYGYRNFSMNDHSKNTLPVDFLMMGELYQNNHHRFGMDLNFAKKWFEIDLTYWAMKPLILARVVKEAR
jgi:stearoyl-CoA desaturase (delta-9 desaturase)